MDKVGTGFADGIGVGATTRGLPPRVSRVGFGAWPGKVFVALGDTYVYAPSVLDMVFGFGVFFIFQM